jgi:hypothetical protein
MADPIDPVAARLAQAPTTDAVRADAWDAFHQTATADEFAARVKGLAIPDAVKADLWDLKQAAAVPMPFTRRGGMTDAAAMVTPEVYRTTNEKDASGAAVVRPEDAADPNTLGTLAAHAWHAADPGNLLRVAGQALAHPIDTVQGLGAAQQAPLLKAKASYDAGDYPTTARHLINYLLPFIGPALDTSGDAMQRGQYAAGVGDALGLGLSLVGPAAIGEATAARYPLAAHPAATVAPPAPPPATPRAAAVQAGQAAGVPLNLATVTGNDALLGLQKLTSKSLGGSIVAQRAAAETAQAMDRWGDQLADVARGAAITPEQAGQGIRDALASKLQAHTALADHAYEQLRALEADPTNRMQIALPPQPVDVLGQTRGDVVNQLRRIVHELDASGYVARTWNDVSGDYGKTGNSGGGDYQIVAGSGGAQVYHDIMERMSSGSSQTRGEVQAAIEDYLGGGKETAPVKAAIQVAKDRFMGARDVSTPELPPSAMSVPTRLEPGRVTSVDMGFPVDLVPAKKILQPLYDQMTRQMPITQQQASPGLKAIQNILEAPDTGPLSQIDRDLSAIKTIGREQGGLAKEAARVLDTAVRQAAANGGPQVMDTLIQGRRAVQAGVDTQALIDALPGGKLEENRPIFQRATAADEGGLKMLRALADQTPTVLPQLARAKLQDLAGQLPDAAARDWRALGPETKALLFPQPGQLQQLENFFLLRKLVAFNPNASGSGLTGYQGAELAALVLHPATGVPAILGNTAVAALLSSPTTTAALNRVLTLSLSPTATTAARTAAAATLLRVAQHEGIPLPAAAAAQSGPPTGPTRSP